MDSQPQAYKFDDEVTFIHDEECEQEVTMTLPAEQVQYDQSDDGFVHVTVTPEALMDFVLNVVVSNWDEE